MTVEEFVAMIQEKIESGEINPHGKVYAIVEGDYSDIIGIESDDHDLNLVVQ